MLLRFLLVSTYFLREGPIEDLMKFLPISSEVRLIALRRIYSAPYVFIKFYDIFNSLSCLFFFNGIEIISAPFIPISLSYNFNVSSVLFCNSMAAKHRAPSIPNEFFLIDPSSMPKLSYFMCVFLINSSRIRERPTSLIILLARFRFYILVLPIIFFMACMPY
jgi:hypothetical protein